MLKFQCLMIDLLVSDAVRSALARSLLIEIDEEGGRESSALVRLRIV